MQKYIKLIFILILTNQSIVAQYPCFNGISTNPLNPIHIQLPSKLNNFFNWEDSLWQMQPSPYCYRTGLNESH